MRLSPLVRSFKIQNSFDFDSVSRNMPLLRCSVFACFVRARCGADLSGMPYCLRSSSPDLQ